MHPIAGAPQEKPRQQEALRPQLESSPCSLQLQKAQGQQRRPSTAKNKNKFKKIFKEKTKAKDKRPTSSSGAPGPIYVKSLQSCPTLCDPRDGSPPGSSVHGICQAGALEWGHKFLLFLLLSYILRVLWSDRKQPCGCCPSLLEFLPMQFSSHAVGKRKQPSERPMWRGSAAWSKPLTNSPEPF